ncbi:uncharacterized protein LOC114951527 [Acropora millepora]|uniref:uncharacterized protein LOC114951527 n=1 Tax=Acropora millepora TaxID=45264 RepID=UPI001CF41A29|nr:uncharacterized protein LOC114951527 [Acropora millepora]
MLLRFIWTVLVIIMLLSIHSYVDPVLERYGSGGDDQLIFLVPSTQQAPIFVDRIEGEAFSGYNIGKLYDRIKCMIQGINIEREQLNKMKSNEVEKGSEPHFSNVKQSEDCSSGSNILIKLLKLLQTKHMHARVIPFTQNKSYTY